MKSRQSKSYTIDPTPVKRDWFELVVEIRYDVGLLEEGVIAIDLPRTNDFLNKI